MLHAELHGKSTPDTLDADRREDVLTSTVFGTLFVAEAWDVLCTWLGHAQAIGQAPSLAPTPAGPHDYWFWPRLDNAEPDLVVRLGDLLVVVEAKYFSGKSGDDLSASAAVPAPPTAPASVDTADDDSIIADATPLTRNQLVREWRACQRGDRTLRYPAQLRSAIETCPRKALVYLVKRDRTHHELAEVERSAGLATDAHMYLLTWEQLDSVLASAAPSRWKADLSRLPEQTARGGVPRLRYRRHYRPHRSRPDVAVAPQAVDVRPGHGVRAGGPATAAGVGDAGARAPASSPCLDHGHAHRCSGPAGRTAALAATIFQEGTMMMTEALNAEQFRTAVAAAVEGVLNVYREVDGMLRELAGTLALGPPHFQPVIKRLVPGVNRKNPDARYLRSYVAAFFTPADLDADVPEDEDDDGEGDDDDEGGETPSKAIVLTTGSGILMARVAIYQVGAHDFEPNLLIGALTNCRSKLTAPPDASFRVRRSQFKRIIRAFDTYSWSASKPLQPDIVAQLEGQPGRATHPLVFDVPQAPERHRLFPLWQRS